ncbi:hypothetical protein PoB_003869400 [Plakobranchus ocellatus]|uniref:Uncharacterized protein n=1 Tax=Plakobranchus ocellatus TaxID=259542 RepID=A0AAV4B0H6_9GAST|nr:hypothetical protein PoB_003869400 [Plakobranchus ocellatus]
MAERADGERKRKRETDILKEVELEKFRCQADGVKADSESGSRGGQTSWPNSKMFHFMDEIDDLTVYCWLTRLEKFADMGQWPQKKWASSLSALQAGRVSIVTSTSKGKVWFGYCIKPVNKVINGFRPYFRSRHWWRGLNPRQKVPAYLMADSASIVPPTPPDQG